MGTKAARADVADPRPGRPRGSGVAGPSGLIVLAGAAAGALAGVQLVLGLRAQTFSYVQVLELALAALTAASALFLLRHPSVEARLAVFATATAAVGATLLALTVGLPGGNAAGSVVESGLVLALGSAAPLLLATDHAHRRHQRAPGASYAP